MNLIDIKDDVKEIEEYRNMFGHVGFVESGKLILFCKFLLSRLENQEEENKQVKAELEEFKAFKGLKIENIIVKDSDTGEWQ